MTGTMVKVDRARLLEQLEQARTRAIVEHDKRVREYPDLIAAWNVKVAKALHALADRMNGKVLPGFEGGWYGKGLMVPVNVGSPPDKPGSRSSVTCNLDRMIRTVRLVSTETFQLRTDDSILRAVFSDRC